MKARVKATGEVLEISEDYSWLYVEKYDKTYYLNGLEFLNTKNESLLKVEPDYWEKLKHQAAISAMQGLLSNSAYLENFIKYYREDDHLARVVSRNAIDYATILIDKLKEEENESK